MKPLVIRYTSYSGKVLRQPLVSFSYNFGKWVTAPVNEKPMRVKCLCGGDDWTDNGRLMNEYECACCGAYIQTEPVRGY